MGKRFSRAMVLVLVLSLAGGAWADLVGHWRLDEESGTVAEDSSGNGNNGTLEGSPTVVDGRYGRALSFAGNRVAIPASDSLAANLFRESFGLSVWINPTRAGNTWQQIFRSMTSSSSNDTLFINNDGHLTWRGFVGGTWTVLCSTAAGVAPANEWTHAAVVGDGTNFHIYVNGALSQEAARQTTDGSNATYYIAGDPTATGESYAGIIDDVQVYDHALTLEEVTSAMLGIGREVARDPSPENEATDVLVDTSLTWVPGRFAAQHDVYLGTVFDDVNDASASDPRGVLASQGQADPVCDLDTPLEYGQTYYWRVDEVNGAPDYTVFKGGVWSFTTETYGYPITDLTVEASGAQLTSPAIRTIDGSGLDALDQHGTDLKTMWVTPGGLPAWIEYTFDRIYKLHELWVWNGNSELEMFMGFGAQDVAIEYSTDGETWTPLENVPEFAQGTGQATYTASTVVDFGGAMAKHVRLTINDNWGATTMVSLSEVRFFYVPVRAFQPDPADEATDVSIEATLSWRPGREATSHEVYLGTDANAVADKTVAAETVADHSYTPPAMNLDTVYYWKVNEVGDIGTYEGDVWSFTTQTYIVVDDFESYDDDLDAGTTIWHAWIDGVTTEASGSQVGYIDAANGTFGETTIVHSGEQSMPLFYDNAKYAVSEAELELSQDWTTSDIKSLSLFFQGTAGNTGKLYVKINNAKVAYDGPAGDIAEPMWLPWSIDLSKVGNVSSVRSLTIGIEGAGATGTLYIDDIRLYPRTPEYIAPTQPDTADLVAHYKFDGDLRDSVGSSHGTAMGNAAVANDPTRGQALSLDGTGDAVDVAYSEALNPEAFTVSLWAMPDPAGTSHRSPLTSRDDGPQRGYILYIEPGNAWQFWTGSGTGWDAVTGPMAKLGEWSHVAASFVDGQQTLYINGRLAGQGTAVLSPNTQRPLRIGGGATESTTGNYFFMGMIDEVRLYDRALSAEEVAGLAGQTMSFPASF